MPPSIQSESRGDSRLPMVFDNRAVFDCEVSDFFAPHQILVQKNIQAIGGKVSIYHLTPKLFAL